MLQIGLPFFQITGTTISGMCAGPRCSKPHNTSLRLLNLSPRRLRRHPRLQEIRFDVRLAKGSI